MHKHTHFGKQKKKSKRSDQAEICKSKNQAMEVHEMLSGMPGGVKRPRTESIYDKSVFDLNNSFDIGITYVAVQPCPEERIIIDEYLKFHNENGYDSIGDYEQAFCHLQEMSEHILYAAAPNTSFSFKSLDLSKIAQRFIFVSSNGILSFVTGVIDRLRSQTSLTILLLTATNDYAGWVTKCLKSSGVCSKLLTENYIPDEKPTEFTTVMVASHQLISQMSSLPVAANIVLDMNPAQSYQQTSEQKLKQIGAPIVKLMYPYLLGHIVDSVKTNFNTSELDFYKTVFSLLRSNVNVDNDVSDDAFTSSLVGISDYLTLTSRILAHEHVSLPKLSSTIQLLDSTFISANIPKPEVESVKISDSAPAYSTSRVSESSVIPSKPSSLEIVNSEGISSIDAEPLNKEQIASESSVLLNATDIKFTESMQNTSHDSVEELKDTIETREAEIDHTNREFSRLMDDYLRIQNDYKELKEELRKLKSDYSKEVLVRRTLERELEQLKIEGISNINSSQIQPVNNNNSLEVPEKPAEGSQPSTIVQPSVSVSEEIEELQKQITKLKKRVKNRDGELDYVRAQNQEINAKYLELHQQFEELSSQKAKEPKAPIEHLDSEALANHRKFWEEEKKTLEESKLYYQRQAELYSEQMKRRNIKTEEEIGKAKEEMRHYKHLLSAHNHA